MARGEDAFTAADSLCRLQRLQATCGALRESEGVDALLFVGGVDGRDNLGSVRCLNFLLGGVGGVELHEREQCVGKWGEDVVLLVRPDGCEIHVGHAHYEALRPFIAAWGNVEVHTLPPRHIPKRPDREDEARDDDEASSDESLGGRGDGSDDSEEEEEEEDVLQDFKLTALVSMLTGVTTVGVACTPNGPGEMETERWPLLQAYGIEGVGRSGFFTMSTTVVDTWDVIHRACFTQLDGAQLRRELARSAPPFRQHWEASLATMDARRAPGRMTLTPALAFDPLTEFFAYGTLRRPVGFGAFDEADAPRVGFGLGTDDDLRGGDDARLENVRASAAGHARGPALHCTVEARHPKSPGLRCARTYVFGQGCVTATAINGFTKRVDDDDHHAALDSENQSRLREPPRATDEADVAALVGLYAAAVAAGRDAASAACDAWAAGAGPETWTRGDAVEIAVVAAARRAFAGAADAIGVPPRVGSDRASALDVSVDATDPSNARPSPAAGDGAIGERRGDVGFGLGDVGFGHGVARCAAYVRVALRGIVGVESGEPLGAIVYGDSFVPGGVLTTGDGGEERSALAPLVLTSGVPLVRSWPAAGAETDACEGCGDATRKMVEDARLNFRARRKARAAKKAKAEKRRAAKGGRGGAEDAPAEEAAKASTADDEVFLDDELEFESEEGDENAAPGNSDAEGPEEGPEDDDGDDFFASSDDDDDDDDAARSFAPLASTYRVDETLALGPSLLVPKPEPVLAFVPAFDVRSGSSSNPDPDPDPKPSMDPRVFDVVSGDDGARAGEWHVFDNGVAFVPDHGVPLHLVLGVNVAAIDIHDALVDADGVADDAAGPVAVFRLSRPCAIAPSHLFLRTNVGRMSDEDDDGGTRRLNGTTSGDLRRLNGTTSGDLRRLNGTTSVAFSLAPLGDASKRHFARVVVPRWRRVASGHRRGVVGRDGSGAFSGCEVRTGLGAYAAASPSQAWACGRARSTRERAGGIALASAAARAEASVAHKRFQTREPDSAVIAAATALDATRTGLHTGTGTRVLSPSRASEARARDAPKETGDRDDGASIDDDVELTLLVGAPDGCQDEVFDALRRCASGSATWIATEAVAPCHAADSVEELARALASNVAGAVRAAGRGDGGARKPRRVCVIARTYESAAEVAASVTEATTLAAESSSARTSPPTDGDAGGGVVRMRLGAVTACVAADGFFADAERRPARGALAQVTPPACDNVVLLPTGAASRGAASSFSSFSSAPGAVPAPTSRELLEDAGAWIRAAIRARGGDVNVTVGARRLLSSPLAAATATKKNLAFATTSSFAVPPTSDSRRDLARRRVVAEGDVDLRAVVSCVRGMFALGRRARPKSPEELRRLPPDERLAYDLSRFAEVDPASPVVAHAEIAATIGGDGDTTTMFRRVYNFTAAARGEDVVDEEDGADAAGAVATRVEITVSGSNVAGEGLNLAERVRACARRGPPPRPLRTAASLREEELAAVARRCKDEADLPTGWYYDGAVYVSYDGLRRTSAHPRMDEYVGATVEEMNGAIEEWNARAEEARNALRGVTITAEEVRAYA